MGKRLRMKRRAASHLLYLVAQTVEHCWFLINQLLETNEGSERALTGKNDLEGCLTDKEDKLLRQRAKKLYDISRDLSKISRHLWKTSQG